MASAKRIMSDLRLFGRGYLRNVAGLFFGLVFPVILILIFGAIFSSGFSGAITLYVQNQDGGQISVSFLNALNKTGEVSLVFVSNNEDVSQYLSVHSASDGLVIPADFSANYMSGKSVNVTLYGNPSQSSSTIVTGVVNGVINRFNLGYYKGRPIIGMAQTTANSKVTKYVDFLVPGLVGFSILVSPMFSLVNISSEYKRVKLFKQLSLTPLTKMEWLSSKVVFYILLSIASFLLMVAVGVFCFWCTHCAFTLVDTFSGAGTYVLLFVGNAGGNSFQDRRDGQRGRKHHNVPDDVSLWHVLPHQPHASVFAIVRTCPAAVLHNRRTQLCHDIQQLCTSSDRPCRSHNNHDYCVCSCG